MIPVHQLTKLSHHIHRSSKNSPKQFQTKMYVGYDKREQQGMDFFTRGNIIMNYGFIFARSNNLNFKDLNDAFYSYKHNVFSFLTHKVFDFTDAN